uniref:G-protein coupled receptors family 1 profile domain-containing protein n=1 Tax=Trichobilharzia regenti TaxID=157069 RepID=A0AA85JS54_TRIRE|nr:unnamed protein product [Trichobilharzia regenti]
MHGHNNFENDKKLAMTIELNVYIFIKLFLGTLGISAILFNICVSLLWIFYIFGCKSLKCSLNRSNQNNDSTSPSTRISTGNSTVESVVNDVNYNSLYEWPKCSLRTSTKIFIFSIVISDLVGHMTSGVRFTILSTIGKDIRLCFSDLLCRAQIYLAFTVANISGWQFSFLCFERCYILIKSNSNYTRTPQTYWLAITLTCFTLITALLAEIYALLPDEKVCSPFYTNRIVNAYKSIHTAMLPALLTMISSIMLLTFLVKMRISFRNRSSFDNRFCNQRRSGISGRITMAKRMFFVSVCHLLIQSIVIIFANSAGHYCCYYTSKSVLHLKDYFYIMLIMLRLIIHSLRTFLLISGSSVICRDIKIILRIIKTNVKDVLNI